MKMKAKQKKVKNKKERLKKREEVLVLVEKALKKPEVKAKARPKM